jgi:Spy/CpxP family protein refolding chaperone
MMTARCGLSDAQTPAVKQIIVDRENSIEKIRSNSPKGTDKKAAIEAIRKESDTKLSNSMSPEQWQKWLSFQEEQKKRKEAGQKNGGNSESID